MKEVINFNHISAHLNEEEKEILMSLYKSYHKRSYCLKKAFLYYRNILIGLSLMPILLSIGGVIGTGVTLNPVLLSMVAGGLTAQALIKKIEPDLQSKKVMCKFGYNVYMKILNDIKTYLRSGKYNEIELLHDLQTIDNMLQDLMPLIVEKYQKNYIKKYLSESGLKD